MFKPVVRILPWSIALAFPLSGLPGSHAQTGHVTLPQVTVTESRASDDLPGVSTLIRAQLARKVASTSDTARLLGDVPGMSVYSAGGVSSLPSLHGLADDRLRIKVDGMDLVSACANHMNPALSYIDPTAVESVTVFGGIAPVSAGGDSIGGAIVVATAPPVFAPPGQGTLLSGQVGAFYRSNGHGRGANVSATVANENLSLRYTGASARADNYEAAADFKTGLVPTATVRVPGSREVGSSQYQSNNQSIDLAWRNGNHVLQAKVGGQVIPFQGFPNQRMDMTRNASEHGILRYDGQFDWGKLQARAYSEHTRHTMNFLENKLRDATSKGMPMDTEGTTVGGALVAEWALGADHALRAGAEWQRYRLDDWWSPVSTTPGMMAPNVFWNIRNGQRDRADVYAEWDARWSAQWTTQLGLRTGTVTMNSGLVQGYNNMSSMMGYGDPASPTSQPGAFNAADRARTDQNGDLSASMRWVPDATASYSMGVARKTRSPNLYERYTWSSANNMVMNMVNWFGDANGFVGNLALKPEVAYTASLTADWHDGARQLWSVQLTPHYTEVHDYIDAVTCARVGKMCPTRTDGFANLSFANQGAKLWGWDLSAQRELLRSDTAGSVSGSVQMSYLKAINTTTQSALYNTMPFTAKFGLNQRRGAWTHAAELQWVDAKSDGSTIRNEQKTAAYALLNVRTSYSWKQARLDFGIDNLLDRFYAHPQSGAYVGQRPMTWGIPVPGAGRSISVGLNFTF